MILSYKGKVIIDGEREEITDDMFRLMKESEKKQDFIGIMAIDGSAMVSKNAPSAVLGLAAIVYEFIDKHGSHNLSLAMTMGEEIARQGELQPDTMAEYEDLIKVGRKEK